MNDDVYLETSTASNQPAMVEDSRVIDFRNVPIGTWDIVYRNLHNEERNPELGAFVAKICKVLIADVPKDIYWSLHKERSRILHGKMPDTEQNMEGMTWLEDGIVKLVQRPVGTSSTETPVVDPLSFWEAGWEAVADRDMLAWSQTWNRYAASQSRQNAEEIPRSDISDTPADIDRASIKGGILSLLDKASKEGWDGEEAAALKEDTVKVALELVDTFPGYLENPDVDVSPFGEIDFDWVIDKNTMLTVSVISSKEIGFSGLFDRAKLSGSEPWSGTLPQFVKCCFERLKLQGNS